EMGRRWGGNVGVGRGHRSGVDGRNPGLEVEVGRPHNALRLNRRATEIRKWQSRNGQGQRGAPRLHPPIDTIVDHETSGLCGSAYSAKVDAGNQVCAGHLDLSAVEYA